jgi:uncharacterized protein YjbJ (UPF0337 family)
MTKGSRDVRTSWSPVEANWAHLRALARERWARLTDADFDQIAGDRDRLLARLRTHYGISEAEAELEVNEWESVVRHRQGFRE